MLWPLFLINLSWRLGYLLAVFGLLFQFTLIPFGLGSWKLIMDFIVRTFIIRFILNFYDVITRVQSLLLFVSFGMSKIFRAHIRATMLLIQLSFLAHVVLIMLWYFLFEWGDPAKVFLCLELILAWLMLMLLDLIWIPRFGFLVQTDCLFGSEWSLWGKWRSWFTERASWKITWVWKLLFA